MKQIENIFSKKETKIIQTPCPNPNLPILVDTREKQSLIPTILINKKANIKFEKLEIGDYLISDTIIERKTNQDFFSSMINKRLQQQLINLKKYPKQLLIIEGENNLENSEKGMILSTILDFQIPIIFTQNQEQTTDFLILLAKKYEKHKSLPSLRYSKTPTTMQEQKQFILEGFPGIGPTIAQQLLKQFSSLKEIFNASKQQLNTIEKFNMKNIEKFKQLLET